MKITVAGSGAFGTALSIALAQDSAVTLLGRDADAMQNVQKTRKHPQRLPGITLPEQVTVSADPDHLRRSDIILLCVPTQKLGGYLKAHGSLLSGKSLVACCKGIELRSLHGTADVIANIVPDAVPAVLTGPSFAADIARGLPTALTLATGNEDDAIRLQPALTRANLRIYRTNDVIGAQLGGALKNVVAIAAGVCIGAGLGDSARAALITRGFAEMQKLARCLGAQAETLMGLSGFGDLILTCGSEQSRNFSFGQSLGRGLGFDASVTVEGAATAQAVTQIARDHNLDLPVACAVDDLIAGRSDVQSALQDLLSRPLREE